MFEKRLRLLLVVCGLATLVVLIRLFQLQVVEAAYYRERAHNAQMQRPEQLQFIRGSILDRANEILVSDEASWEICMDFDAIAAGVDPHGGFTPAFVKKLKQWYGAGEGDPEEVRRRLQEIFAAEIDVMWRFLGTLDISDNTPSPDDIRDKATRIYQRLSAIRKYLAEKRGYDEPIREERQPHAILPGLTADAQIYAREQIARFPWLGVRDAFSRTFAPDSRCFAHLLGRMGRVQAEHIVDDPDHDDRHRRYIADEPVGISGVEKVAERLLRGRRGQIRYDREGAILPDHSLEARHGQDVFLTVHGSLQRKLYEALAHTVTRIPDSPGGAITVIDVRTREVLALVSYPSYDPHTFNETYQANLDDSINLPLMFRAVTSQCAPGSTVKPLICLEGLNAGLITLDTRENCNGYFSPSLRNSFRCWPVAGTDQRMQHGSINVVEAIKGSCNIFMYRLGERLRIEGTYSAFDMVGLGRTTGTGLMEEAEGLNPSRTWMMHHTPYGVTPGTARQFAIGQGQVLMTPIQVANLMATYADGRYQELAIIQSEVTRPAWKLPHMPAHLAAIKKGMYQVVNAHDGTAHRTAFLKDPDWALCGKTGSATVYPRPTLYRVPFVGDDGSAVVEIPATSADEAAGKLLWDHPRATFDKNDFEIVKRWPIHPPKDGGNHSHAWFGAFLQRIDKSGRPLWSESPHYAFSVLVEFGGSGGRTSGPLAKEVASTLIEMFERPDTVNNSSNLEAVP